jgi:K+-sensing histidine kinase KdpD
MLAMTPTQHILVVANETATGEHLHRTVSAFAVDPAARVLVVAPAPRSRWRRQAAEERLHTCVTRLDGLGLDVEGRLGDEDPMRAIADALVSFPATELVIGTHPRARSSWLADELVDHALARFGLPTLHTTVEVPAPRTLVAA